MKRRGTALGRRLLVIGAAAVLALSLAGDRGRAATVTGQINGQDPLEVLALSVKPNIFVVLDTSGSMGDTPYNNSSGYTGDFVGSKLYLAKQVLKSVFQANATKAQFLFGNYRYSSDANTAANMSTVTGTPNRFLYSTQSWASGTFPNPACTVDPTSCPSPNPNTVTLSVQGPSPSMATTELAVNSLYAYQWIQNSAKIKNNVLVFNEAGGVTCTVSVATGFYTSGSAVATAIQNAMNSCSGKSNTYTVSYGSNVFTFQGSGSSNFTLQWGNSATTLGGVINAGTSNRNVTGTGTWSTGDARINLLYRSSSSSTYKITGETYDPDGASTTLTPALDNPSPSRGITTYFLRAQKFWNGETVFVDSSGNACAIVDGPATNPPTVSLELTTNCANGAASGDPSKTATFTWGGGQLNGAGSCQGFKAQVPLIPCDQLSPPQYDSIAPFLDNQLPLDTNGAIKGYGEQANGTGIVLTNPDPGGVMASSNTPLAQSLNDIRGIFANLWNSGQAAPAPVLDPIKDHKDPKERTVVIMVTDGLQNCSPFTQSTSPINKAPYNPSSMSYDDASALGTAAAAEKLYDPGQNGSGSGASVNADGTISGDAASSVTTYVVGFGLTAADKPHLDVIAWAGSGMQQGYGTYSSTDTWTTYPTAAQRYQCKTCVDAFLAPDPDTLKNVLQSVIDVGAQTGDFTAQQSITESVFEYVDLAKDLAGNYTFNPGDPGTRYKALAPVKFVSSFSLPGFKGQVKAYMNDGSGNSVQMWSAGDKLTDLVTNGMASCNDGGSGSKQCIFSNLSTKIARRIYTTSRNGVYTFSPADLANPSWTPPERVSLWPVSSAVAPADYASQGSLDVAMGLPADSSANPTGDLANLETTYRSCLGGNLPTQCTSGSTLSQMKAARREAREMILAFMAGAAAVAEGTGVKRTSSGLILYAARDWVLADSELATVGVVTPPSLSEPEATNYVPEYRLYRDGVGASPRSNSDLQLRQGFGLVQPDIDKVSGDDSARNLLKPVMTVVYAPANDMLHAFRAGPNCVAGSRTHVCTETGGEELWGFVPYDQLDVLGLRLANEPESRTNHVYMIARGVRFADVFVPGAASIDIGGYGAQAVNGVWRRVLYFGRGIAGKYVTALDVTAPGPYTALANDTAAPIPLWNRGNPDTYSGRLQQDDNQINHDQHDYDLYRRMGETWSIPTIAFVNPDKSNPHYVTSRRPDGIDFAIFMGSGYGTYNDHGLEGVVHYTLDALSGDVVAAADVEAEATALSINRDVPSDVPYFNSLVANSVSFNRSRFGSTTSQVFNTNPHPWSKVSVRVYIGDLHGRLWRFLTTSPGTALPVADLGADQPIGTAVALISAPPDPALSTSTDIIPVVQATAGNERRATGPCLVPPPGYPSGIPCFRNFSFSDEGDDADLTIGPTTIDGSDNTTTYAPMVKNFSRVFDQGEPEADCGYTTQAVFRGTIQPTNAVECSVPLVGSKCNGTLLSRVFFGGTRLSPPITKFAPPTPLACSTGDYPCRSQFDSILYALGVFSGQAAYDMNATGDDAYRIFRDSRIAALSVQGDPDPNRGGSSFTADEGLMKGTPKPPPPPGVPPTATTATANVVMQRVPGQPPPAVRYGSSVCSEQP